MTHSTNPHAARRDRLSSVVSMALAATLGLLASGLILAMLGLHVAWLQAPLAVALGYATFRQLPQHTARPIARSVAAVLLALIVVVSLSNLLLRSELVVAGRDGATYANTASFLVADRGLFPTAIAEPFVGTDLEFKAPGFVVRPDGTFWQQFLHSTPATYAFFGELFGKSALFGVNAFMSGVAVLVVFALASRFMRPWWALLAAALLATALPFVYYSRGTFSEMAALVLSLGGLWAGHVALSSQPQVAIGSGLLLGGATMVRVDAWLLGIALGLLLVTATWLEESAAAGVARRIYAGLAIPAALGLLDLVFFAEPYVANIGRLLLMLVAATVGLRLLTPLAAARPLQRLRVAWERRIAAISRALTVTMAGLFAYLWFVRPLLPPSRSTGVYGLGAIQLAEGLAIEPDRAYTELSVWWQAWYLGIPIVAASLAAAIVAARRSLAAGTAALRLVTLAFLVQAVGYFVRPSINPDQIWAIRRFLPVVIPGMIILAVALGTGLIDRLPSQGRSRPLAGLVVAAAVLPVILVAAPLIGQPDRQGVEGQLVALCESLEGVESVLIVNDDPELPLSWLMGPPLRAWCGFSVAGIEPGREPPVPVDAVMASTAALAGPEAVAFVLSSEAWRASLRGAPRQTEIRTLELWVARR